MKNTAFDKIKKTLAILLILCFVLSVTAAVANAGESSKYGKNKDAYKKGYNKGYKDGKRQSKKDCRQYGSKEILHKIPDAIVKSSWTKEYKESYTRGYEKGYIEGYNRNRYACLKK